MVNGLIGGVEQVNADDCKQNFPRRIMWIAEGVGFEGDFVVEVWVWDLLRSIAECHCWRCCR